MDGRASKLPQSDLYGYARRVLSQWISIRDGEHPHSSQNRRSRRSVKDVPGHFVKDVMRLNTKPGLSGTPVPLPGGASSGYLQSTLLSCEAAICHLPSRFNQVSVQTWHCFASGCVLSLPMACSLP